MVTMVKCINNFFGVRFRFGSGRCSGFGRLVFRGLSLLARVLLAEFFLQIFESQAISPKSFGLWQILGIGQFMTIDGNAFVRIEGELLRLEEIFGIGDALLQPQHEALENLARRVRIGDVPALGQVVEISAIMGRFFEVGLDKMEMLRVEGLEVAIEKLTRDRFIEGLMEIMQLLEQPCSDIGNLAIQRSRTDLIRFSDRVLAGGRRLVTWGNQGCRVSSVTG